MSVDLSLSEKFVLYDFIFTYLPIDTSSDSRFGTSKSEHSRNCHRFAAVEVKWQLQKTTRATPSHHTHFRPALQRDLLRYAYVGSCDSATRKYLLLCCGRNISDKTTCDTHIENSLKSKPNDPSVVNLNLMTCGRRN